MIHQINFQSFFADLRNRLAQPLPGEAAQYKMAPARRLTLTDFYESGNKNPHRSAVLICLYPHQQSVYTLLMLRPDEPGAHSGQVSFPGGRFESHDVDLQATAIREAQEEVGIQEKAVNIAGPLSPLYIPVSNNLVQPFVGFLEEKPFLLKNDQEVKEIIETDILWLLDHSLKSSRTFPEFNFITMEAPYYNLHGHHVWGATAMMLSELEHVVREILKQ